VEPVSAGRAADIFPGDGLAVNVPSRMASFLAIVREVDVEIADIAGENNRYTLRFVDAGDPSLDFAFVTALMKQTEVLTPIDCEHGWKCLPCRSHRSGGYGGGLDDGDGGRGIHPCGGRRHRSAVLRRGMGGRLQRQPGGTVHEQQLYAHAVCASTRLFSKKLRRQRAAEVFAVFDESCMSTIRYKK